MSIKKADSAGFCFGVKRAVEQVYEQTKGEAPIYTFGPIIHNEEVVPYALFAEADDGITQVTPEEAHGYKKLFVSWSKKK